MPIAKGRGGKNRKKGKSINQNNKRELLTKQDDEQYGQVLKLLGNGKIEAQCFDGRKRICNIRGKMRRKVILLS